MKCCVGYAGFMCVLLGVVLAMPSRVSVILGFMSLMLCVSSVMLTVMTCVGYTKCCVGYAAVMSRIPGVMSVMLGGGSVMPAVMSLISGLLSVMPGVMSVMSCCFMDSESEVPENPQNTHAEPLFLEIVMGLRPCSRPLPH